MNLVSTLLSASSAPPLVAPVKVRERIVLRDVLRGFTLLGILLMNIQSFAMPEPAYSLPTAFGDMTGANRAERRLRARSLHFCRSGPVEWLWRSLTYWQLQPLRRNSYAPPTPA